MLSINQTKLIRSLQKKKHRETEGLYVIEGDKLVREYLDAGEEIVFLIAKAEWISRIPDRRLKKVNKVIEVNYEELKKISSLKTPHNSIAIIKLRRKDLNIHTLKDEITLALENIQDPGNLGTIIRTAAWFGIKRILCSKNCVDLYNPKVIQATMGALLSTEIFYVDLIPTLKEASGNSINIYATTLTGESVYDASLEDNGIVIFGNESTGITPEVLNYVTDQILIPPFVLGPGIESLNVATSVSVICSEFRRRKQL